MQGGINRGKDLLPRYNAQGNKRSKGWLSTPMKKLLVYAMCLVTVFVIVHTLEIGKNEEIMNYELDHAFSSGGVNRDALESQMDASDAMVGVAGTGSGSGNEKTGSGSSNGRIIKEKFSNDLISQKEVSENAPDSAPIAAKNANKNSKSGNDVKAVKQGSKYSADDQKAQEIKAAAPYKKDE